MSKVKKILAVVLTLAMVMGMSITSFAAKTGASITVTGLATNAEQTVSIYKIFGLDANNNNWVKDTWVPDTVTPENLDDAATLTALKEAALTTTAAATKPSTTGTVTFDQNIEAGAYLVIATDTVNKTVYNPMVAATYEYNSDNLIVVKAASVVAKADSYTIDKTQDDADQVVEVGDLVKYTIKTTIPYLAAGETGTLKITDTLSGAKYYLSGAAVKGVVAVSKVTVGGQEIAGIGIPLTANGGTTFEINLDSLVTAENTYAGQEVVVEYTAAVDAVDEITNTANSNHVSDPEGNVTKNYTGQLKITKYGEAGANGSRPTLKGAVFAVYRMNGETKEYAEIGSNGYITGVWIAETEADKVPEGAGTITTGDDGTATVKGLDVGTYFFKETIAPEGYSIGNDVSGDVTKTGAGATISVSGATTMNDTKLSSLPETGGIGTTIFTIGGVLIMIAAAFLYFRSRKKSA